MGWSDAGFRLLKYLKDFADSSAFWEATAYYNHPTNDEGKINLHHHSGWDFYITRRFDSDYDEMIYMQPLSTVYSSYAIPGESVILIENELIACTYISRPWIENGEIISKGISDIYIRGGENQISWCAQVGISNVLGFGISSWGSLGFIGDYRFVGGLPYDSESRKPFAFKNHFWTADGNVFAIDSDGTTYCFIPHSLEDLANSNPFVNDDEILFRLFQIYLTDSERIAGSLPDIYWLSNDRVLIEPSDGITIYIGGNEIQGRVFRDGNNFGKWAALLSPVKI